MRVIALLEMIDIQHYGTERAAPTIPGLPVALGQTIERTTVIEQR